MWIENLTPRILKANTTAIYELLVKRNYGVIENKLKNDLKVAFFIEYKLEIEEKEKKHKVFNLILDEEYKNRKTTNKIPKGKENSENFIKIDEKTEV